jgi:hypothetical protein
MEAEATGVVIEARVEHAQYQPACFYNPHRSDPGVFRTPGYLMRISTI